PDPWHDEHRITCWLNTRARRIDLRGHRVELATGDVLEYDRLILAAGSRSVVPPVAAYGIGGCFTLRDAADAIGLRAWAQQEFCTHAVVAGGGLLGLEAAYALHKVGLSVTVLERGPWLLRRQLDETGGRLLQSYLERLGLTVLTRAETERVTGADRVDGVELVDGRPVRAELFLACAGVTPNIELARDAGLAVKRGVVVDDLLRTSDPDVFAAGDVAEVDGDVSGLWPP